MEARKAVILSSAAILSFVILIIILRLRLGNTTTFFGLAAACLLGIIGMFVWLLRQYTDLDNRRQLSIIRRAAQDREGEQIQYEYSFLRRVAGLPARFKYETLLAATDGFSAAIGRGSSAMVYKGILDDGTAVAVKRIEIAEEQGERAFRAEVSVIASVQHLNLVRLLGYCILPNHPRYLVYEFVANGSLDKWIFPRASKKANRKARQPVNHYGVNGHGDQRGGWDPDMDTLKQQQIERCLPWALRCRIAADVARALAYLHSDCRNKILHMDVKPENILLDEGFRGLVADFGLSKLMGRDQSRIVTTVRGTRGYLAPEWLLGRGVTEKSDVYSYGLVLLEIVGGRRSVMVEEEEQNQQDDSTRAPVRKTKWSFFPKIVMDKVNQGRVMDIVDRRLLESEATNGVVIEEKDVINLVHVAMWCIQEDCKLRPSMARVVDMLEGRLPAEKPPDTNMVIIDLLGINDGSDASGTTAAAVQNERPASQSRLSICFSGFSTMSPR